MALTDYTWSPKIAVGHDHIDGQHGKLLDLAARVETMLGSYDFDETLEALDEVVQYTRVHFRDEEDILREAGYADLDQHMRKHQAIMATVDFAWSQRTSMSIDEVFLIIRDVVIRHITTVDSEYKPVFG